MKIMILGGYGAFGGRLAELLADLESADIFICGRSLEKAQQACLALKGSASYYPVQIDRININSALSSHRPDVLVDASGPFQAYGADPYFAAKACIDAGVHYLDLADDAAFVIGISQLNSTAIKNGVTILSGVSTCPVLSSAALREISHGIEVRKVTGGIAPSPHAKLGKSVVGAVMAYAGGNIELTRNGQTFTAKGLTESLDYVVSPPGHKPLKSRRFSLVDIPDLQILPLNTPNLTDIWFGAGTVPVILLKILNGFAKIRARLRLPALTGLTSLAHKVMTAFAVGEHRGGMFIEIEGYNENHPIIRSWHLIAEGDHGPYIPAVAAAIILRKWNDGQTPDIGARAANQELELADFTPLFKTRNIATGIRNKPNKERPLFHDILGLEYENLPPLLKGLHGGQANQIWSGEAVASLSKNPLAKLIRAFAGIKIKPGQTPVNVHIRSRPTEEIWTRNFGGDKFTSRLSRGARKNQHLIIERFGPIRVALAITYENDRIAFIPRRWFLWSIAMPQWLLPQGESYEYQQGEKFHFDVSIKVPIAGVIAAYKGWLKPNPRP